MANVTLSLVADTNKERIMLNFISAKQWYGTEYTESFNKVIKHKMDLKGIDMDMTKEELISFFKRYIKKLAVNKAAVENLVKRLKEQDIVKSFKDFIECESLDGIKSINDLMRYFTEIDREIN